MHHQRGHRQGTPRGRGGCAGAPVHAGFTLVEVMVALAVLAIIATLTWRGIDGMVRAQAITRAYTNDVLALQAGLAQWQADLNAMVEWPGLRPSTSASPSERPRSLDWDGNLLRITRSDSTSPANGVRVIAWMRRSADGRWLRWQSRAVRSHVQWQVAWDEARHWAQEGAPATARPGELREVRGIREGREDREDRAVAIATTDQWRLHYFRNNAWSHSLSSAGGDPLQAQSVPDAIRLLVTFSPGQALDGTIELEWVSPTFGARQ